MGTARILSDFPLLENALTQEISKYGLECTDETADYLLLICLGSNKLDNRFLSALSQHQGKAILILGGENQVKDLGLDLSQLQATVKFIHLGELYSNKELFGSLKKLTQEAAQGQIKSFAASDQFFVVSVSQAAAFITRELFTYVHAKDLFFTSRLSIQALIDFLKQKGFKFEFQAAVPEDRSKSIPENFHLIDPGLDKDQLLQALPEVNRQVQNFQLPAIKPQTVQPEAVKTTSLITKKRRSNSFKYFYVSVAVVWLVMLPYLVLLLSVSTALVALEFTKRGQIATAQTLIEVEEPVNKISLSLFKVASGVPVFGVLFEPAAQTSQFIGEGSSLLLTAFEIGQDLVRFKNYTLSLSDENLNFNSFSSDFKFKVANFEKEASLLLSQTDNGFLQKYITEKQRQSVLLTLESLRRLAWSAPELLGAQESKTYLVLLQNNMELRPTGGFIGSFMLVTFDRGKLIDRQVYDVYSADGQLKGYVKPPYPIVTYLGEENWYLRDSNWDPDFLTTAKRAEWFLDKSIGQEVDGVVAVNLNLIADMLAVTGPLKLADFDDTINQDNVFLKLQSEVEQDFFPGSRKKAHYLSAFADGLWQKLSALDMSQSFKLAKALEHRLEAKDLQFAFWSEPDLNNQVLGSTTVQPEAGLQFVEANLGVNKVNLYISRKAKLWVNVGPNQIQYTYQITFLNSSPNTNPPEATYGVFARLLTDPDSRFEKVKIIDEKGQAEKYPELYSGSKHLEAGVFVQVLPGIQKTLEFKWVEPTDLNFSQKGSIAFGLVKQSGVEAYPVEINFQFPAILSLTNQTSLSYNTILAKDQVLKLGWK